MNNAITFKGATVLVVENELVLALNIMRQLAQDGIESENVAHSEDAIRLLGSKRYDAVFLDGTLEDGTTWKRVVDYIKQSPLNSKTPIIAISDNADVRREQTDAGCQYVIEDKNLAGSLLQRILIDHNDSLFQELMYGQPVPRYTPLLRKA